MSSDTYTPVNLLASNFPVKSESIVLEADASDDITLAWGTVLAKKPNGKYVIVDDADADTDDPEAVLTESVTIAATVDKTTVGYLTGDFIETNLKFGGDDTADTHRAAMRNKCMFMSSSIN